MICKPIGTLYTPDSIFKNCIFPVEFVGTMIANKCCIYTVDLDGENRGGEVTDSVGSLGN